MEDDESYEDEEETEEEEYIELVDSPMRRNNKKKKSNHRGYSVMKWSAVHELLGISEDPVIGDIIPTGDAFDRIRPELMARHFD